MVSSGCIAKLYLATERKVGGLEEQLNPIEPVVCAVLSSGGSVRVGCAAGVDAAVRSCCPSAVVVRASLFPVSEGVAAAVRVALASRF